MNDIDVRSQMTRELFEELASKFLDRAKGPLSQVHRFAHAGLPTGHTHVQPAKAAVFCCVELQQHNGSEQTCSYFCLLCGKGAVCYFCCACIAWSIVAFRLSSSICVYPHVKNAAACSGNSMGHV